ncbi:hypothetical protein ACLMJK_000671 [Lecanora helva]
MPHKHEREKGKNDSSLYDLPPSARIQPLSVAKTAQSHNTLPHEPTKHKRTNLDDDTPKAFLRLLKPHQTPRSGLDDGSRPSKRRKASKATTTISTEEPSLPPTIDHPPTIQPHEPLSSFNARVDAALPFSGLSKRGSGRKDMEMERKTKTERKMQRMQREWREEDKRRREQIEEQKDEAAVDEDVVDDMLKAMKKRKRRRGKEHKVGRGGDCGDASDDDEDPWAHIEAKRFEIHDNGGGGLVGLHDVVEAPPRFSRLPKEKSKGNIGLGSGGVKRQVELSEARQRVIDGYRQMMKGK